MVACRFSILALLSFIWSAAGVLRHSGSTFSKATAPVHYGALLQSTDKAEVQRVAGLLDVERDLETDKKKDDTNLRELESQIVALVHKRDAAKRDEGRKDREIAFLQSQIGKAKSSVSSEATAQVAQETQQEYKADSGVESAIASADQVVKMSEAAEVKVDTSAQVDAQAAAAAQAAAEAEQQRKAQAQAAAAQAVAAQEAAAAAAAVAAAKAAEAEKQRKAAAAAAQQQESRAAFEARIRAEMEAKARVQIEAETKVRAKAEAEARAKVKAEEAAQKKAAQERVDAENAQAEAAQKKKNELADHADDSFKDFMKEEDGEDEQGDPDYEDSANALAGAIGWDRKDIEHKADSAVKQLTEAIGGKKVVQSLQGMMAGVGR